MQRQIDKGESEKMDNWNLSEKIEDASYVHFQKDMIPTEDVKEFIRLLKKNVLCYNESKELMLKELDKLAGEKLK